MEGLGGMPTAAAAQEALGWGMERIMLPTCTSMYSTNRAGHTPCGMDMWGISPRRTLLKIIMFTAVQARSSAIRKLGSTRAGR